jgi:hypothetical protein
MVFKNEKTKKMKNDFFSVKKMWKKLWKNKKNFFEKNVESNNFVENLKNMSKKVIKT